MSPTASPSLMTTEEMLALPANGLDRELIDGQLRERPMTKRNRSHSNSTVWIARRLLEWQDTQAEPCGQVVGGEAGFVLRRNPDTSVGIDVAYVSSDVVAKTPSRSAFFEGPPVLAVEILSPSDQHEDVAENVRLYIDTGVALVWLVDPDFRTVTVHRPDAEPELFNARQEISAEPHLPGFRIPVAKLFGR